jgi:hypothetical protein
MLQAKSSDFVSAFGLGAPSIMTEGEGANLLTLLDQPLPWLKVEAKLWQQEVTATLPVLDQEAAVWAALAFGTNVLPTEDTRALADLARRGGAVTDQTSYVVGRTRHAPPPERGGTGLFGRGHSFSTRCGMGHAVARSPAMGRWLRKQLRQALYTCGGMRQTVTVRLETTGPEIVRLRSIATSDDAPDGFEPCLKKTTWRLRLPPTIFKGRGNIAWTLEIEPIFR